MHRSGTSAMARLLSIAGAALPAKLMSAAPDNPTGFWEPVDIVEMNDRIMGRFDLTWDDVFAGVRKPYLKEIDDGLLDEAVALLEANYGDASPIVLKDPRVAVLGDFWRRALDKAGYAPRYVIMVRHPLEVAASLSARNGFSREKSLLLWSSYMVAAERDTRDAPRIFVSYQDMLDDWRGALDGVEANLAVTLPRRTSVASLESDQFLRASMRHHVQSAALDEAKLPWAPVKTLYDWFLAASDGKAMPNTGPHQADDDLAGLNALFGPILAEARAETRADAERSLRTLSESLETSHRRIAELEESGAGARREVEGAQAELARLQQEAAALRREVADRHAELATLRDDGQQVQVVLRGEIEARATLIANLEGTIKLLQSDLDNAMARDQQAEDKLVAARLEVEALGLKVAELSGVIDAREREHQAVLEAAVETATHAREREYEAELEARERAYEEASGARERAYAEEREEARIRFVQELERQMAETLERQRALDERAEAQRTEIRNHERAALERRNEEQDAQIAALTRQVRQHEQLAEEIRMAAALESRTLKRHLHEQTQALHASEAQRHEAAQVRDALMSSTSWRITAPLRRVLGSHEQLARGLRNGAKLAYWTATFQLPQRLRRRREFFAAQAAAAQIEAAIQPPASSSPAPQPAPQPAVSAPPVAPPAAPAPPKADPAPAPRPRREFAWRTADQPDLPREVLGLYDVRTDDAVPREAERGRLFLDRFDLLSDQPRFKDAVNYLNAKRRTALGPFDARQPRVSVIVPIYGQLAYTLNCLDSLLDHASRATFEIIIGDDVSPDQSGVFLPQLDGVTVVRHEQNGGFVLNCNRSAARARGELLLFLNNDTRVVAGWLDELVDSFEQFPKAGLVGSKLFYPDGSLQEAGGIIWRDGTAWNYGREQDPNRPEFCYARQVDYISGASIVLPRPVWDEMGGFDELYKPAYCEDADLALKVAASGREVWLQPLSRVIHYEGKTSGTDTTQGAKAYQVVNLKKMFERWEPALAAHRPNAQQPILEKDRNVQKRALIIDVATPTPDQDAGSVVTMETIKIYQALGYKVTFLPRDNFLFDPIYSQALQRMGVECLYAPYVLNFTEYMQKHGASYDVVQVFRIGIAERCLDDVRQHAPQAPFIFHNVDLHYLRMERQAEVTNDPKLREEAAAMKVRELAVLDRVDCTIVTSPVEEEILKGEKPGVQIVVFPYLVEVAGTATGYAPRRDIMFLGGYRHTPNVDAAEWLVSAIWPRLAEAIPEANLLVVGAHPTDSVKALAGPRIEVTGMVPELRPYFDQARVFVAPIRYGAGIKGKVATAMAHGLPVVATSCAAEGMFMQDERDVLIADDVDGIVARVLRLYREADEWNRFSEAGQTFIADHNSVAMGRRVVMTAIDVAMDVHAGRPS